MASQQDFANSEASSPSLNLSLSSQRRRVQSEQAQPKLPVESVPVRQPRRRPPRTRLSQPNGASHGSWADIPQPVTPSPRQILKRSSRGQMSQGHGSTRAGTEPGTPGQLTSSNPKSGHSPNVEETQQADTDGSDPTSELTPSTSKSAITGGWVSSIDGKPTHYPDGNKTIGIDMVVGVSMAFASTGLEKKEASSEDDVDGSRRRSTKIAPDQALNPHDEAFPGGKTGDQEDRSGWQGPSEFAAAMILNLRRRSSAEVPAESTYKEEDTKHDDHAKETPGSSEIRYSPSSPASSKIVDEDEELSSALYQNWLASGS